MHGPQSYEGSGGESSGDEEDLDREVQRSLCGLGRNSRNTPGLGTKPTREDNSRTNPHFENLTSNPSFENSRSNSSSESTLGSNLLQVQGNLGSQSSFHSAVTRQGSSSQADTASLLSFQSSATAADSSDTCSFYSTGTLQGSRVESPSSLSYLSLGSRGSVETLVTSTPTLGLGEEASSIHQVNSESFEHDETLGENFEEEEEEERLGQGARQRDSYVRPGCLAGSAASGTTGSMTSLASDGEVSFAGRVNEQVGRLLGYSGGNVGGGAEGAMATITGYEVLAGEKEKYTVYKLKLSTPSSVPSSWFIHRRYSDFLTLRATLLKESPSLAPRIPFPPKRWVGSNLEPAFLGRRLAGLQVFLATVMEDSEMRRSPALSNFLCLGQQQRAHGSAERPPTGNLEASRAVCDTLEETVRELREQLRKREQLEGELEAMRNQGLLKDAQICHLEKENELLKQQKESLMAALSSSSSHLNTSLLGRRERRLSKGPCSRVESLEDFTAKFGLNTSSNKVGEGQKRGTTSTSNDNNNNKNKNKEDGAMDHVRRRGKVLERESDIGRRKSSIQ